MHVVQIDVRDNDESGYMNGEGAQPQQFKWVHVPVINQFD